MGGPTWLADVIAAVMVGVSLYCVGRLLLSKPLCRKDHHDANVAHVLMGLAMAGMLLPRWNPVPNSIWEVVFSGVAAWFLALSVLAVARHGLKGTGDGHTHAVAHYLIHMVMAGAMLYVYRIGPPAGSPSMTGHALRSAGDPGLALLLVAILLGSAVWQIDSIPRFRPAGRPLVAAVPSGPGTGPSERDMNDGDAVGASSWTTEPFLAPRLEITCHVLMCVTMGYMLVLTL